jgi:hypothetical protein
MAIKDTTVGLLSKMAKFVRHPTKDWSELDHIGVEAESEIERGYTKQSLKEMIERKRKNDFVRRREFDELRKLRRNVPLVNADTAGRPSFFQVTTTTSKLEERAETIKKIDEIEAQMSKQWWKGKQDEIALKGNNFPMSGRAALAVGEGVSKEGTGSNKPAPVAISRVPVQDQSFAESQGTDFDPTQPGMQDAPTEQAGGPVPEMPLFRTSANRSLESSLSGFSPSKLFSTELGDSLADSDMEEAAIRFANGDDAGAEAGLLTALKADHVRPDLATGWAAALFDLYRATGQQNRFDHMAAQCARRFRLVPPIWFSTPELLGRKATAGTSEALVAPVSGRTVTWACPARLDLQTLLTLKVSVSCAPEPWRLDWCLIESITPDAGEALADLFAQWCGQPVVLHFDGAEVLDKMLRTVTPSGDKGCPLFWWRLRLDALRLMGLQDEFELAALDFCVTYEVSPPPWQPARCEYSHEAMTASGQSRQLNASGDDDLHDLDIQSGNIPTMPMEFDEDSTSVIELSGEVLGDAAEALGKLQAGVQGAMRVVIACDRLIRVDFSAAGSILNWVAARETEGCHVQFRDVPRLVAAFFNVIGISEHAKIMLRTQ